MFSLQHNVPVMKATRPVPPNRRKYPMDTMEVGDMFFVPGAKGSLPTYCAKVGTKMGVKFNTRSCHMLLVGDEWLPAKADTAGAVKGIGVWRVE